jgi:hypothetical protein
MEVVMKRNLHMGILALILVFYPAIGTTANIFEITGPISKTYIEYVDYAPFALSHMADVTNNLQKVGGSELGNAADFSGFAATNIALIKRGTISFHDKVMNAQTAGASAAIIYNNVSGLNYGTLSVSDTNIPSISVSDAVGLELLGYLDQYGYLTVHLNIDTPFTNPIPEPGTMMLLGSGLVVLVGYGRRRFKK